jgi:xanthine dehydrogenase accessory factor
VNFSDIIKVCHELESTGQSYAVVTMIRIDAHVPQEVGAKMIVTPVGLHAGTIGGGKLEAKCIELAKHQLQQQHSHATLHKINLNQDLGMVCGGVATLFIESTNRDAWHVAIYGAGHVGQALTNVLASLQCHLTVVDSRSEWIQKIADRHGHRVNAIRVDDLSTIPSTLHHQTFHIIATPGHTHDLIVLSEVLKNKNAPYIGVIGSTVKARKIRATLLEEGWAMEDMSRFHCPMGLPIGNNTPAEIAISIAAQMLQTRKALNVLQDSN